MSTKLEDHLWPKGKSITEPELMPSVLDSDGQAVVFTSPKRKTSQATVVHIGDSPNSNNGDPLRTAFAKVNNFIEATYWVNEAINQKFAAIDSELREGIFIYTDSDERVNLSLLDNSKLYFKGTNNQIELNVTHSNADNRDYDFDSEIYLNFQLTENVVIHQDLDVGANLHVNEFAQFDSDVKIDGGLDVDRDTNILGDVYIKQNLTADSDASFGGNMYVGDDVRIDGKVYVREGMTIDSDITVAGASSFGGQMYVNDEIHVTGHGRFDSDVSIRGSLIVNGTTTSLNTQNLEVADTIIVLNKNQSTPLNDVGIIHTRYDSDNVSAAQPNFITVWDESTQQFNLGYTDASGILPNPNVFNKFFSVSERGVAFYDSEQNERLVWDSTNATFAMNDRSGNPIFYFDGDDRVMTGQGEIDGGLF